MDATPTKLKFTNDEYFALPESNKRYELHAGDLIEMPKGTPLHGLVLFLIARAISDFVFPRELGYVTTDSIDYALAEGVILEPDASFLAKGRYTSLLKRFSFAPDLAVEVLSPANSATEMTYKTEMYLRYGGRLVWIIDPENRVAMTYHTDETGRIIPQYLRADETLSGGEVLPGFTLSLKDLFDMAAKIGGEI